ncbi:hypothetical protein ACVDFE_05400 [Lentzea chajnantorensis]
MNSWIESVSNSVTPAIDVTWRDSQIGLAVTSQPRALAALLTKLGEQLALAHRAPEDLLARRVRLPRHPLGEAGEDGAEHRGAVPPRGVDGRVGLVPAGLDRLGAQAGDAEVALDGVEVRRVRAEVLDRVVLALQHVRQLVVEAAEQHGPHAHLAGHLDVGDHVVADVHDLLRLLADLLEHDLEQPARLVQPVLVRAEDLDVLQAAQLGAVEQVVEVLFGEVGVGDEDDLHVVLERALHHLGHVEVDDRVLALGLDLGLHQLVEALAGEHVRRHRAPDVEQRDLGAQRLAAVARLVLRDHAHPAERGVGHPLRREPRSAQAGAEDAEHVRGPGHAPPQDRVEDVEREDGARPVLDDPVHVLQQRMTSCCRDLSHRGAPFSPPR